MPLIESRALVKTFGQFNAVDGVDVDIDAGQCFGLLGPNGAGKSTFIGMTYGTVVRTSGDLKVFGLDPNRDSRAIKKQLGVVTQDNALDEALSVHENMMIYASFVGVPRWERKKRVDELLEYMNLSHKADSKILFLSGGMKRRLVFVRALLGQPKLLILDEPTTGLDPAVRHLLWGRVKELRNSGVTIVLTTHYMHEAEVLCDKLVIFNQGKVVASGSPKKMIDQYTPGFVGTFTVDDKAKLNKISGDINKLDSHEDASGYYLRVAALDDLAKLNKDLDLKPLQIRPANMEDVFLKLTGKELTNDA